MNQAQKNKLLLASLVLLLTATCLYYFFYSTVSGSDVNKHLFLVPDLADVDHVELVAAHDTVRLDYDGVRWRVNDRYDADGRLIDVLFATLEKAEAKREVAASRLAEVTQRISQEGVEVNLFVDNARVGHFFAGGNSQKTEAYFQEENGPPYVMTIPGYRVYVSGIFEAPAATFRHKRLFNFNWANFRELSVSFPNKPVQDFSIARSDQGFGVVGMAATDTTRLNDFLDAISLAQADHFISHDAEGPLQQALSGVPQVEIEVRDVGDRNYKLTIYGPADESTQVARMGDGMVTILPRQEVAALMHDRDFFRRK